MHSNLRLWSLISGLMKLQTEIYWDWEGIVQSPPSTFLDPSGGLSSGPQIPRLTFVTPPPPSPWHFLSTGLKIKHSFLIIDDTQFYNVLFFKRKNNDLQKRIALYRVLELNKINEWKYNLFLITNLNMISMYKCMAIGIWHPLPRSSIFKILTKTTISLFLSFFKFLYFYI